MQQIFLSRPNWVSEDLGKGLDGFLEVMRSYELSPRTIGTTDYPSNSPMDEVIRLMKDCVGAIILGYPQIFVESGRVKKKRGNC